MMDRSPRCFAFALVFVFLSLIVGAHPVESSEASWPQFRGIGADGTSREVGVIPSGAFFPEVVWHHDIGSGYSSLSIAHGKVVTAFSADGSDVLVCYDEESGNEIWRHRMGPTHAGHDGSHDGPLSTPAIDEARVYMLTPLGKLFAVDAASGELIWLRDLARSHGAIKPLYGCSTSPLLFEDSIILQLGAKGAGVAAFDRATGDLSWTCGDLTVSYQSVVPAAVGTEVQLLAAGMEKVLGIDPANGEVLWNVAHGGSGDRGASSLVPVPVGSGRAFLAHDNTESLVLAFGPRGGKSPEVTWKGRTIQNSYNVPVHHEGHLYAFSARRLTCVDAATGERKWRSRDPGDGFLILVDGHLVVVTKEGSLHVIRATPVGYQEVASLPWFEEDLVWSPPSFANGHVYARSLGSLAKFRFRAGTRKEIAARRNGSPVETGFLAFLAKLERSDGSKSEQIDRYLRSQTSVPIIEGRDVHFVYRGEAGDDLSIAGDMIGARREKRMKRVPGTDLFHWSTELEPDARINYMFIKDYRSLVDPLNPRTTITTMFAADMEVGLDAGEMKMSWLAMPEWREPRHLREPTAGSLGRSETMRIGEGSEALDLTVQLPVDYDGSGKRYPVVYIHDGPGARGEGRYLHTLGNTMGRTVAPVIAVFVDSPYTGPGSGYESRFAREVVPEIDRRYRTIASREGRACLGQGFAGLAALECGLLHQDVVSKIATQSAFIMDELIDPIVQRMGPASPGSPMEIHVEWGRYDLRSPHEAWDMTVNNPRLVKTLKGKGYEVGGGIVNDGAGWSSWKNRTDRILRKLFPLEKP